MDENKTDLQQFLVSELMKATSTILESFEVVVAGGLQNPEEVKTSCNRDMGHVFLVMKK